MAWVLVVRLHIVQHPQLPLVLFLHNDRVKDTGSKNAAFDEYNSIRNEMESLKRDSTAAIADLLDYQRRQQQVQENTINLGKFVVQNLYEQLLQRNLTPDIRTIMAQNIAIAKGISLDEDMNKNRYELFRLGQAAFEADAKLVGGSCGRYYY